jgi:DNA modification methylase
VLLVDEAHLPGHGALDLIRMLTNAEMDAASPLACLLIGQPTLRRMIKLGVLAALDQRIALRYAMPGMTAEETASYTRHHLTLAGRSDPLFSDDAITVIHDAARGLPRAVNNLATPGPGRRLRRPQDHRGRSQRPDRRHRSHDRLTSATPARTPRPRPAPTGGAFASRHILTVNDANILMQSDRAHLSVPIDTVLPTPANRATCGYLGAACGPANYICVSSNEQPGGLAVATRGTRQLWALDNLEGLARLADGSVRLVYLDPPFNSGRTYDAILALGRSAGEHRRGAFADSWTWSDEVEALIVRLREWLPTPTADFICGLVRTLGGSDIAAYLVMMAPRLAECRRILADNGSLYLHCDPTASHYLKVLLDHLFGPENFRNEISWKRTHAHSSSRRYGPVHDVILFYSKTSGYKWNPTFAAYSTAYLEKHFRLEDERGRYQLITCTAPGDRTGTRAHYVWRGQLPPPGRHWAWKREQMEAFEREGRLVYSTNGVPRLKRYTDDGVGVPVQDLWTDINRLDSHSEERVGFETQKPIELLERIIAASSDPGDFVVDPFGGSGTTAVAAERLGRQWVCMDASLTACSIALARVRQEVNLQAVELGGFPADVPTANRLRRSEPLAFGLWGTSMLATMLDRREFNDRVATGTGQLRIRSRTFDLVSWVPLRSVSSVGTPVAGRSRLSKMGFWLRAGGGSDTVRQALEKQVGYPIYEVGVENLVDKQSLRSGIASSIKATTATAR